MSTQAWDYDGSFEALVALAHKAYREGSAPSAIVGALAEERAARDGELFAPDFEAASVFSPQGVESIAKAAAEELRAFSGELFDIIMLVWMSEEALELMLFRICAEAGIHGPELVFDHGRSELQALSQAAKRVNREIERMKGLARFSPGADGLYSAPLSPDANILPALFPFFERRFARQDFALVDTRRRLAMARKDGCVSSVAGNEALDFLPDPLAVRDEDIELWRLYFKAIENPARRNPALQRRLMPLRYWRYLPEIGA